MGYNQLLNIRRIERECAEMGFRLGNSKYGVYRDRYGIEHDVVAVFPEENSLPIYSRDAELFAGTFDELGRWLQGVKWAKSYYGMLGLVNDKKVAKKEQDYRNEELLTALQK